MYFYVDESGHTGLNLFDENQPVLYYGVITSTSDLEDEASPSVAIMREKLGVGRLHANHLGVGKLTTIADDLLGVVKAHGITFDLLKVMKPDYALMSFFDQVFDQGLNPAVPWNWYWTPLKYVLLFNVVGLFDLELLKAAWVARVNTCDAQANEQFVKICEVLITRGESLSDPRAREIVLDGLTWAAANPDCIHYNSYSKDDVLQISPNLIGFQAVMHAIASRLGRSNANASRIIVDRQNQFNKAQQWIAKYYADGHGQVFPCGVALPEMDLRAMPVIPLSPTPGDESVGLELVDILLWIFKRYDEGKELSEGLFSIIESQAEIGRSNEVSIAGLQRRWSEWFRDLPDPSPEELKKAKEMRDIQEGRRMEHVIRRD